MKLSSTLIAVVLAVLTFNIVSGGRILQSVDPRFPLDGCNTNDGWHAFEDSCYKLMYNTDGQPGNVFDVSAECQREGPQVDASGIAYLADILSLEENTFIANTVANGTRAWIGAFRFGGSFRWEYSYSQGPRTTVSFNYWKNREPNNKNGQENCVEINRGKIGRWNDLLCMKKRPAICKYSITQWNENQ